MCASRLIVTPASYGYAIWYFTRSGTGSFQRDSALWSSHLEYSGFIAAGRTTGAGHSCHRFRLYDRRAPLPFSGA